MRDIKSNVDAVVSLAPAARTNGTANGTVVDLHGYEGAMVVFSFGAWTDGTHMPSVQHSDDGVTFYAVDADDLQGTLSAMSSIAGQNAVQRIGYIGSKRYLRAVLVTASATTGALSGANVLRGHPALAPV
jgi:hypothetical protein